GVVGEVREEGAERHMGMRSDRAGGAAGCDIHGSAARARRPWRPGAGAGMIALVVATAAAIRRKWQGRLAIAVPFAAGVVAGRVAARSGGAHPAADAGDA